MMFRDCNKSIHSEKGKEAQKNNDGYRKLKNHIKEKRNN